MGRSFVEQLTQETRPGRGRGGWKWTVCGLLLLASAINYMDRQTLANASVRITSQFHLTQEQYGNFEWVFGWAFAVGSLGFGLLADKVPLRWLYPSVLVLWSGVGFLTGLAGSYPELLGCRTLLGFFEGGHWPCAVKTTQLLLAPGDRAMGNSVLQSGTSIGAVITPLVMSALLTEQLESWRIPFQVIGGAGLLWAVLWFLVIKRGDLESADVQKTPAPIGLFFSRRMLALFFVVACINTSWQTLRAWLPKFLQEGRGYTEAQMLHFNAIFYVATDIGCLGAGLVTLWLVRRSMSVHSSRMITFFGCAVAAALALSTGFFPRGAALLAVLLVVGAGVLGTFPIYHALTQEISPRHQGKVTGVASVAAWIISSPAQSLFGKLIDRTHSFNTGLAIAGILPLAGWLALAIFWKGKEST